MPPQRLSARPDSLLGNPSCRWIILWLLTTCPNLPAQTVLYLENFDGVQVPALPAGWSADTPHVITVDSTSSNYQGASGLNNLTAKNCTPVGESRSFQVEGISTANAAGIRISFGHRRTSAFTSPVSLEWSNNGADWHEISYALPSSPSVWTQFTSATLPAGAENQSDLRIRWTYITNNNNNCLTATPNYRIDDFRVTAQIILPVELLSFQASSDGPTTLLTWSTASERNNEYFSIERSTDGLRYREIGRVEGAGNSDQQLDYQYMDDQPAAGWNYYRLRQVDFDGAYAYSPVRSVRFVEGQSLKRASVFPSLVTESLRIHIPENSEADTRWHLFDSMQRLAAEGVWTAGQTFLEIPAGHFKPGLYVLHLTRANERAALHFVKK